MDAGQIIEFDEPQKLLENKFGIFYDMVKALGDREFNRLSESAAKNCITSTNL